MTNWKAIQQEWETSEITFIALAEKYGLKDSTIRSRKNREKWQRNATPKKATQRKNDATKKSGTGKKTTIKAPKKRSGNPNPVKQFTKRNRAAVTHGLFSKFLPPETLEIMDSMNDISPADLIYDQIQMQYAAIIRAQQIMYVENKEDITRLLKRTKEGYSQSGSSSEEEYEIQFAWDKHAAFMNAQSRAMSELRNLIKQFSEMAHDDDERRLKLEQMQVGIERTKAEIEKINGKGDDGPIEILISRKGDR